MARHRKQERSFEPVFWKVGKYIRLSREDGNEVSESVANQDKILDDEIPGFFEEGFYEVVDTYIDGSVIIGLNQKHPTARGRTGLVLF